MLCTRWVLASRSNLFYGNGEVAIGGRRGGVLFFAVSAKRLSAPWKDSVTKTPLPGRDVRIPPEGSRGVVDEHRASVSSQETRQRRLAASRKWGGTRVVPRGKGASKREQQQQARRSATPWHSKRHHAFSTRQRDAVGRWTLRATGSMKKLARHPSR